MSENIGKFQEAFKQLLRIKAAGEMLENDNFREATGLSDDIVVKYNKELADLQTEATIGFEDLKKEASVADIEAVSLPTEGEIKSILEEASAKLEENVHSFPEGTSFAIPEEIHETLKEKVQNMKKGAEGVEPGPHDGKFKTESKVKLSDKETKIFEEAKDHAGKTPLEAIHSEQEIAAMRNHVGNMAAATNEAEATAAMDGFKAHVETLGSEEGILKGLKPEARAGAINRLTTAVIGDLNTGDGKNGTFELSAEAKKVMEPKELEKAIAEKAGSSKNWLSKVGERGASMMEGVNAKTGEALGETAGKLRVAGGSAVALGGIVIGAKNIVRGVAGYDNPETGQQEPGSFGKVAFGAAEMAGGAAAGLMMATGRVR